MQGLAASTIVLFFLVLPGILLREGYKRGGLELVRRKRLGPWWRGIEILPRSDGVFDRIESIQRDRPDDYPKNRRPIIEEIFQSLFWAAILHAAWVWLAGAAGHPVSIGVKAAAAFLFGKVETNDLEKLVDHLPGIWIYCLSLYAASYMLGRMALMVVREWRLDMNIMFFRMRDHWFYLLRGGFCNFRERQPKGAERRQIFATTCTVGFDDELGTWAYTGKLAEYHFDNEGALEYLVLEHPKRISSDEEGKQKQLQMEGEFVVIRVQDSRYLLLDYLDLNDLEIETVPVGDS